MITTITTIITTPKIVTRTIIKIDVVEKVDGFDDVERILVISVLVFYRVLLVRLRGPLLMLTYTCCCPLF